MKRIEVPSFSSEIMTHTKKEAPGVCHFLRLPLELRDPIYRMLLTTEYCTYRQPTSIIPQRLAALTPSLRFNLQPAILLVNKQISAEATRILYHGNDFIILKITGLRSDYPFVMRFPEFRLLSEDRIPSPVLRIQISPIKDDSFSLGMFHNQQFLVITTPEGLQPIIGFIWRSDWHFWRPAIQLSLTLNFNLKTKARYDRLSNLLLKPWDKVAGIKELVLLGDITEPTRDSLEKHNLDGPSRDEVIASLTNYHSLAERNFEQRDYNAAQWWLSILNDHWNYIYDLVDFGSRGLTISQPVLRCDVKQAGLPMYYEAEFKLVIAYLCQLSDDDAAEFAKDRLSHLSANASRSYQFVMDTPPTVKVMQGCGLGTSCVATIPLENAWTDSEPVKQSLEHMRQASRTI